MIQKLIESNGEDISSLIIINFKMKVEPISVHARHLWNTLEREALDDMVCISCISNLKM